MGNKGQLVIRYAGDTRDLEKANKRGVKGIKDFGADATAAGEVAGKASGKGFGSKFQPSVAMAGKAGAKQFGGALGAAEANAKGVGKKAGAGFEDTFTAGAKDAGSSGAAEFGSRFKITISKAEAAGKGAGKGFADRFRAAVSGAGDDGAEGFSSSLKVGAVAGAAVAGAAAAAALGDAMENEKLGDKVAASLNLTGGQAKRAGTVASKLYAGAWGDNMAEVSDAVESVMSSVTGMTRVSEKRLHDVTASVMDVAAAFDLDASTAARDLGILIKTGLARNATEGLDLITTALQKVPKAMRGDVSDAVEEYAQFFADLGFTGSESMKLLVSATEDGKYGIDKMGDSIKEFGIRVSDGSKLTKWSFGQIGLDSDRMSNKFLKGGDTAKKAFKKTVEGLLSIEDPSIRAQASIGLFGTPLEDLGTKGIPKFLESLLEAEGGMGKVEGRAKKMGDSLNDNAATRFESVKRQAQTFLTEGLMALWDGFDTGKVKGDGFAGTMSEIGSSLKPVGEFVKNVTEVPGFGKLAGRLTAIGVAVGGLAVAYKFSGLRWLISTGFPGLSTKASGAAGPVGLVLAGIIALDEWQASKDPDYKSMMDLFVDFPKDPWASIKTSLKQNAPKLTLLVPGMASVPSMMGPVFKIWGAVADTAKSAAAGARFSFTKMREKVGDQFRGMRSTSGKVMDGILSIVTDKSRGASGRSISSFSDMRSKGSRKFRELQSSAAASFSRMKEIISDKARGASENARRTFGDLKDRATDRFRGLRSDASSIWTRIKDGVSDKARRLSENVRSSFGMMKDIAGRKFREFWNGLKSDAKAPVKFVIKTVWNNGLRKMLNAVPGVDIKPSPMPFRAGGPVYGPGTETSDSISARLSRNEHVWTAREVKAAGGHQKVEALRRAALSGNFRHSDPGFAEGGGITPEAIARGQKFARGQMGKPYGWGAVGPTAYDCSGFMSAITNVLRGASPYSRVGSTASFPWQGFKKGYGQFTIGSSPNFSGGIGHMAGVLGGTGVESRGGKGVIVGSGAMPPGRFGSIYHMGKAGKAAMNDSSGGWLDTISNVLSTMRKLPGQIRQMMSSDSWINPFMKKLSSGLWSNIAGFVNKKIPDLGPLKTNPIPRRIPSFDRGGTLSPGLNTVYNGLGRPEPLRRADAEQRVVLEIHSSGSDIDNMLVKILRRAVKARGGNVQLAIVGRGA